MLIPSKNILLEFPDSANEGAPLLLNLSEISEMRDTTHLGPEKEGAKQPQTCIILKNGHSWWVEGSYDDTVRRIRSYIEKIQGEER